MRDLLQYSLERISSLQHFYILEKKSIESKAKKGMATNRFGYLMDMYFQTLTNGTKEEQAKASFIQLQKQAEQYVEIVDLKKSPDGGVGEIVYRIRKPKELEEKGFDIDIRRASANYRQFADMPIIHGNNTIIMLITRFEEFIANFLTILYHLYPHKYLDKQQITFSEIENLGTEAIREKIVTREIDEIMRESYLEWFKVLESHKMKFDFCQEEIKKLGEIYARRNILVHNAGVVNEIYIKNVPDASVKLGDRLIVDEKYLNEAFDSIKIIVFVVMIEAAKFISPHQIEYLDNVFGTAFGELEKGNYFISHKIFNNLSQYIHLDAKTRTMSQINYWIAAKEILGLPAVKDEIEKFDVSALDRIFALAKEVLLENNDEATAILELLFQRGEIPPYILDEWPLFKNYRKTEEYERFKAGHAEKFGVASVETAPEALVADKDVGKSIRQEIESAQLTN